jgi:hypothetical protein
VRAEHANFNSNRNHSLPPSRAPRRENQGDVFPAGGEKFGADPRSIRTSLTSSTPVLTTIRAVEAAAAAGPTGASARWHRVRGAPLHLRTSGLRRAFSGIDASRSGHRAPPRGFLEGDRQVPWREAESGSPAGPRGCPRNRPAGNGRPGLGSKRSAQVGGRQRYRNGTTSTSVIGCLQRIGRLPTYRFS